MKAIAIIFLTLTSIAAWGQSASEWTQWNKVESKDEITDKVTTSFAVRSLPPERAVLSVLCQNDGTRLGIALSPHFQVRADGEHGAVTVPIRIDNIPLEIKGIVQGDLDDWVQLPIEAKVLTAEKEIKIKLWEFGAGSHLMTFKLKGVVPNCPARERANRHR
jgi:hypothetical protein